MFETVKLIEMNYDQVARRLFAHREEKPKIEFWIDRNPITHLPEGACVLKVISIADDVTVVGNYYGGGYPFIYDMTSDEDALELGNALHDYFDEIGSGETVYVEHERS